MGEKIFLDNSENVIVSGEKGDTSTIFVTKYTNSGNILWNNAYPVFNQPCYVKDMVIDSQNAIYITGSLFVNSYKSKTITFKLDSNGNLVWRDTISPAIGAANFTDEGQVVRVNSSNNLFAVSISYSTNSVKKIMITKYSSNGIILTRRVLDSLSFNAYYFGDSEIDKESNIYIGCTVNSTYEVIKLDSNLIMIDSAIVSNSFVDELVALDVDTFQNIYVAGTGHSQNTSTDYFVYKFHPDLSVAWFRQYDGLSHMADVVTDIKVAKSGYVVVTGSDYETSTIQDVCTIKYDSVGNQLWVNVFDTTGNDDFGNKLFLDKNDNVYVMARMHVLNESYATIRYSSYGTRLWTAIFNPHMGNDWERDIWVDKNLSVFVTGETESNVDVRVTTIKYIQPEIDAIHSTRNNSFALFPNPCRDVIHLTSSSLITSVIVQAATGDIVFRQTADGYHCEVSTINLPSGLYFVNVNGTVVKFIKE